MRDLKVVGLDVDGRHILCEDDDPPRQFRLRVDDRLRAAVRGDTARLDQTQIDIEVTKACCAPRRFRPGSAPARRSNSSPSAADVDVSRIERFAHPVLLERARAAELATAAHPVLADGPSVLTLLETVTTALVSRGLDPDETAAGTPGAMKTADGPCSSAGRPAAPTTSRTSATPRAPTAAPSPRSTTPASELIDPNFDRPLRPVAPVAQLDFDIPDMIVTAEPSRTGTEPEPEPQPKPEPERVETGPSPPSAAPSDTQRQARAGRAGLGGRAARGALQRRPLTNPVALQRPGGSQASSTSQATATPTPAPSTNQRTTGVCRHPHTVGASPPTATRLRPSGQQWMDPDQSQAEHDDRRTDHSGGERRPPSARWPTASASSVSAATKSDEA